MLMLHLRLVGAILFGCALLFALIVLWDEIAWHRQARAIGNPCARPSWRVAFVQALWAFPLFFGLLWFALGVTP